MGESIFLQKQIKDTIVEYGPFIIIYFLRDKKLKKSLIDQEALLEKVDEWKRENPTNSISDQNAVVVQAITRTKTRKVK